jgi:5'-deoxynucleotidase YfbR-like HD superfamily hydrolase
MNNSRHPLIDALSQNLSVEVASRDATIISKEDVKADISFIYKLYDLQKIVRFFGQRYWEKETSKNVAEPGTLFLETVAAHSFQVASSARWLAPHFPSLDHTKAVDLALLHDQPEILIGDRDPVGSDGKGFNTHAFNPEKRNQKENEERVAVNLLAAEMRRSMREAYTALVEEFLDGRTGEARFVKAVDKLQALAFVRLMKVGSVTPEHMAFTIRYSRLGVMSYPPLQSHFQQILQDILGDVFSMEKNEFPAYCHKTKKLLEQSNA